MFMAYRKRSLDLPLPPGETQAKHARSGALPPIRSLTELAAHSEQLPALKTQSGKAADLPATRPGDPSLSLAAIRVSSPLSNPDSSAQSAPDAIKVARNWSRDETLSLVRAIGRHYESLKRCKTNQERSNVWHRIHKEHSSQFPGRSKKASQDRWGKVLSDYKDVMVHNKEKGAARWTFDFFKQVAAIVEGDVQAMEATSPLLAPKSATHSSADDLKAYSIGASQHRMSEPSLPHMASQTHPSYSLLRSQPAHAQKLSPVELCPAARDPGRFSPSRRTSYPQMHAAHVPSTPARASTYYPQRHSVQLLSPPSSLPSTASGSTPLGPSLESTDPESACRYALDLLQSQMRRIDAQQDSLNQLRYSTQDAISRVERVLQHYTNPQQ
ncbi:hypothetical protein LPJ78_002526 [Coemansia sp. RSA 989]|nr:hypothetical protein LPJ68_001868 [Coemansia sp. RSA 1086]KAJ1749795.1 hypothetical protein LPJ79_003422 [Coemansia sp. RSA 1821]KAJ1865672.1 hypothetical protein LPJ78_002526 [Coemansia sp. RSA 989]KAJ1871901.1 hypothetical protein LPJ55_003535 [Coemansia sp. RSA 990]KAJ2669670.1 hypothetical protein IWW42_004438 [Coemansia sp. RSA 1085]